MIGFKYGYSSHINMIVEIEKDGDKEVKIKFDPNDTSTEISDVDLLEINSDTT